ncbi:uncharacterized protein LOC135486120 isoform X2 [Lineus longissimus]|uniref:uncharacterized protein LOC135486120 isoform X2 n=1 Tax=Lineus longissimus TaxID=88925 RepID=UPI002B4E4911
MAPDISVPDLAKLRDKSGQRDLRRDGTDTNATASCSKYQPNGNVTSDITLPEAVMSGGTASKGPTAESIESEDNMASGSNGGGGFGFLKNATNKLFSKLSLDHDCEENVEAKNTEEAGAVAGSPKKSPGKSPKKEKGKAVDKEDEDKIEKSKYASMWRNIVNNSMVGTGIVSKAAIVSQDGQILAQTKGLSIKKDQILTLARAIRNNPGELAVNGINLGDENFRYMRSEIGNAVYGVDESGSGGCAVISTKRCLMIGIYEQRAHEANNLVEELSEYLRGRDM